MDGPTIMGEPVEAAPCIEEPEMDRLGISPAMSRIETKLEQLAAIHHPQLPSADTD